ncbi:hypothetical protein ACWV26_08760 [Rummeliibacillus sp. JY-2-4R]
MRRKSFIILGLLFILGIMIALININVKQKTELTVAQSLEQTKVEYDKIEQLLETAHPKLSNQFDEIGLSFSPDKKVLTVKVKDKKFIEKNEKNIKKQLNEMANELKMEKFKIQLDVTPKIIEKDRNFTEKVNKAVESAKEILDSHGLKSSTISYESNIASNQLLVELDVKNKLDSSKQRLIKRQISNAVYKQTNTKFEVKLKQSKIDLQDQAWQPIFSAMNKEANKKFKEYRGFSYSFNPSPLQIIIKTDLKKSIWSWNLHNKIKKIEDHIGEVINIKQKEFSVEEIPYEIIIEGKDNKRIN